MARTHRKPTVFASLKRSFYGQRMAPIERLGHLRVGGPAPHVFVLGHRNVRVPELVGTDPGREALESIRVRAFCGTYAMWPMESPDRCGSSAIASIRRSGRAVGEGDQGLVVPFA